MSVEPPFAQFAPVRVTPRGWLMAEPARLEGLVLALVLALLATLPVVLAHYPQMVDYPAHLARYHVMLERDNSPFLQRYYGFEWKWSGNLGADLLIRPLAALFGLEAAGRLIAGLIPLLTGLGLISAEWALRRRVGLGTILAFTLIWSPALLLGFLNFGLALALALFAFAGWVRLEGKPWRAPLFVPVGVAVWLAHVSGWGVLGLMVFGYEWSRDKSWRAVLAPWPLALPALAMLAGAGGGIPPSYGPNALYYKWAIWKQALRNGGMWLDYGSVIGIGAVIAGSLALRRLDPRLGWATLLLALGSLAMPRHVVGGDLADSRLISSALMVGCLALSWRAPRWVLLLAPVLFLVRLAETTEQWVDGSRETAGLLAALDHLPQGARIANMVVTERGRWPVNTQEHIGGYAVVQRDALINSNFAVPHLHMLTVREGGPGFHDPSHRLFKWHGEPVDLSAWPIAQGMDYLWYVGDQHPLTLPRGAQVIYAAPHTVLARLAKAPRDS